MSERKFPTQHRSKERDLFFNELQSKLTEGEVFAIASSVFHVNLDECDDVSISVFEVIREEVTDFDFGRIREKIPDRIKLSPSAGSLVDMIKALAVERIIVRNEAQTRMVNMELAELVNRLVPDNQIHTKACVECFNPATHIMIAAPVSTGTGLNVKPRVFSICHECVIENSDPESTYKNKDLQWMVEEQEKVNFTYFPPSPY
jgi:hypothetical protein